MAGLKSTDADVRMGARLTEARRAAGLTQRTVAAAIGVSAAQLQKYEKGTNRLSATSLPVIADLVGKQISWFFGDEPELTTEESAEIERAVLGAVQGIVDRRRGVGAEVRH
ncbi:helix-turn-helix domain-containing protein [Methylobacterium gregans]|uniref:HTH cro/C1-type domain-containing protein n=1 Tax=Methylobacterium gregans TaxID=374424 RepID=A0AA37MA56_9HYPH|nr:helix-turn-helix transcriptional regulator [Methylobacterium gregans]MDQ0521997.1 transcriptional regulator with XRE-family HTH domain [Methylobacterium gregans]GJD77971.1 hypothetical protein NBEOAGPD_1183 [Methylobacterium gregans]GLS51941.1 hypothetical protein GCM10007886_01230 [Methylobacterium gregans]